MRKFSLLQFVTFSIFHIRFKSCRVLWNCNIYYVLNHIGKDTKKTLRIPLCHDKGFSLGWTWKEENFSFCPSFLSSQTFPPCTHPHHCPLFSFICLMHWASFNLGGSFITSSLFLFSFTPAAPTTKPFSWYKNNLL